VNSNQRLPLWLLLAAMSLLAVGSTHELIVTNLALSLGMSGAHDNPDMPTQP